MSKDYRILYFGNNWVGFEILKFLKQEKEEVIGLILHPDSRAKFKPEIINLLPEAILIEGDQLKNPEIIKRITELKPDMFISIYFGYILSPTLLKIPSNGTINLHPAYLPYNRGSDPNVWSIIDGTPAGVTLHYIDEGIDTGPIIAREKVEFDYIDTGKTLYKKLEIASIELFKKTWNSIKNDNISKKIPQKKGTMHYDKDFFTLDEINLNKKYNALELINILRARTFPPYKGSYFQINGKKYYVEIKITKEI